jgi:polar amino acid transport system substrate-binding protein
LPALHKVAQVGTRVRASLLSAGLLALCVSAVGCGGSTQLGAGGRFTPNRPGTLTVATAQIPDPGFWAGTPEHPTGGFEYGLARALAERFNLAHVAVVIVPFKKLIAGDLGGADMALSDITITGDRERHLSFSTSYLAAPPSIVVKPGTQVSDVDQAQALTWAVQRGTTLQETLEESILPETVPMVLEHQSEVLTALRQRRVQAVMLDLPVALAYARESPKQYAVAAQLHSEDVLGIGLPKGSENVEAVDSAVRAFKSDGTIERLGRRWLDAELQDGHAEQIPVLYTG